MYKPEGMITALITPFKNQKVDYKSLESLVQQQLQGGIQGFVVNGTTAESPTLEADEVVEIFKFIKSRVPESFPLILGTGSNSTKKTTEATKKASDLGAVAALVVVPYYNKPTQEGMYQHFTHVAEHTNIPIILYNVPSRTVTSISAETCARLSQHDRIVGIKEASGDMKLAEAIYSTSKKGFSLLSGDDGTYLQQASLGGVGCISVLSHVFPKQTTDLLARVRKKDVTAIAEFAKYESITTLLFKEPNPAPVKYILKKLGIIDSDELRLPLVPTSKDLIGLIDTELKRFT